MTASDAGYVVVATAGHIDHGKSTLVQALTGTDPDRLKVEKERGITIELGFAHAAIGGAIVAFVDVPGHERFVKTMLAGVGGVDAVALIVAADESVMPQTREHFDICRLLHVRRGVIVLTKCDLVDAATLEAAASDVHDLVAGSFLDGAPVIPVSARTGQGMAALRAVLAGLATRQAGAASQASEAGLRTGLYGEAAGVVSVDRRGGPSAPPSSAARDLLSTTESAAPRLPIDRVFSLTGFGTVVTGTLQGGTIRVDDELLLQPGERRVRVRGLHVHGRAQATVSGRQRVAVNLAGVDAEAVARGQTLTIADVVSVTRRVDAELDVLETAPALRHGDRVRFHSGTADALGRLVLADDSRQLEPGARGLIRLRLDTPVAVTRGDRFILRSASRASTVAGGRILDPDPGRRTPRHADVRARLAALSGPDGDPAALAALVAERGAVGLTLGELASRGGVAVTRLEAVAAMLSREHHVSRGAARLFAAAVVDELSSRLVALVTAFHAREPLADGLPRQEARARLFAGADPALFDLVIARLAGAGTLVARERLALASHRIGLSEQEHRVYESVLRAYRDAGLTPADPAMLAGAGMPAAAVTKMVELLLRQKVLVRSGGLIFHAEALAALKRQVQELKTIGEPRATVDVATFKQRYGLSRKFAIPLLEWLDRERVTRRVGETRIVL